MKLSLPSMLKPYLSHFIVALLTLLFFGAVYQAFALNYIEPGLTLDPGADYPGTCVDPLADCTTQILRIGNPVGDGTPGSLFFVDEDGNLAEDNDNLFWDEDDIALHLGSSTGTPSSIGTVSEVGGGALDDLTVSGTYTGLSDDTIYVYIESTGTPDHFSYSSDSGDYAGTDIAMTVGDIPLDDGITISFGATTGHDGNEVWQFDVTAAVVASSSGDITFGGTLFKNGVAWSGKIGGRIEDAVSGVLFTDFSGDLQQDSSNFFWDDANNRLGLGTASPSEQLQITQNFKFPTTTGSTVGVFMKDSSRFLHTYKPAGTNDNLFLGKSSGNFTLSATSNFNANTGVGENTLRSLTSGYFNTVLGTSAGRNITTGSDNNFFGLQAGTNVTTGSHNVAIGESALNGKNTGSSASYNVAIGEIAMYNQVTSASNNVALGYSAGFALTTGGNNIFLGYQAGDNVTTGSNNIVIGYNIDAVSATGSNQLSIGNVIYGDLSAGNIGIGDTTPDYALDIERTGSDTDIFALTDSDGSCLHNPEAGTETVTCSSDERLKENITDADEILPYFRGFAIRQYDVKSSGDHMVGVIAQEVDNIYPELVRMGGNGFYTVEIPSTWEVVKAIQELDIKIQDLASLDLAHENSLASMLVNWFADAKNGINQFFAGEIHTDKLCVGDVCVTEEQFLDLVQTQGSASQEEHGDDSEETLPPQDPADPIDVPEDDVSDDAVTPPEEEIQPEEPLPDEEPQQEEPTEPVVEQ